MEWFTIISFVLIGIILIIVEIILIPGTTVVGIIGFCLTTAGIIISFRDYGPTVGWSVLSASALISGITLYVSLRTNIWKRFSLKTAIESKVNEGQQDQLKEGEEGVAVSALRPRGKAEIGGNFYEVATMGNFVESGARIRIIRISLNQIFVEAINQI